MAGQSRQSRNTAPGGVADDTAGGRDARAVAVPAAWQPVSPNSAPNVSTPAPMLRNRGPHLAFTMVSSPGGRGRVQDMLTHPPRFTERPAFRKDLLIDALQRDRDRRR
jgi:hypothetical protein